MFDELAFKLDSKRAANKNIKNLSAIECEAFDRVWLDRSSIGTDAEKPGIPEDKMSIVKSIITKTFPEIKIDIIHKKEITENMEYDLIISNGPYGSDGAEIDVFFPIPHSDGFCSGSDYFSVYIEHDGQTIGELNVSARLDLNKGFFSDIKSMLVSINVIDSGWNIITDKTIALTNMNIDTLYSFNLTVDQFN